MNIIPPEMLGNESQGSDTSKKFDRSEFFPSSLTDGESNNFRLLGHLCRFHPNVEDCSSNGYCGYTWINREGKVLTLTGHGGYPQGLVNWRIN